MKLLWALLKYSHVVFCFLVALALAPAAFAQHQDITRNFECIATYGSGENASDFIAKDHYVFLDHGGKLRVLDIADPAKPRKIASVKTQGKILGIRGPALYSFDQTKFYIMDISDPTHPRFHKSFDAMADDFHPALMGDYLMADEARKNGYAFYIFSIKDPLEPKLTMEGSHPSLGRPTPFCTDGKKLYAVEYVYGGDKGGIDHCAFRDISTSPTTIFTFPYDTVCHFRLEARKVFFDYWYFSEKDTSTSISGSIPIPVSENSHTIWHLDPDWHAKTLENGWMLDECYNFVDKYSHLARVDRPEEVLLNIGHDDFDSVVMTKGALYQMAEGGVDIYDLSSDRPVEADHALVFPGVIYPTSPKFQVLSSLAILNSTKSLLFFDISNPVAPVPQGEYPFETHNGVNQAKISGNRAYLIDGDDGLVILDISNPKSPRLLARHQQPKDTKILTLQGYRLFLSDGKGGFHVLDCANLKSPKVLGECREGTGTLCISGSNLYMAKGELKILDISNLKNIHAIGSFKTDKPITDIATSGTTVFLLTSDAVRAVDASDPGKPIQIGSIKNENSNPNPPEAYRQCLKRLDNALYLVTYDYGHSSCKVIDISNSRVLKYSDYLEDDESAIAPKARLFNPAKYSGWYLCLPYSYNTSSDDHTGLYVYDCSEPLHPHYAGTYDGAYPYSHILLYKDTIYLPGKEAGLIIIRHTK